jgi:nucleotide-binding universal stress UspA family protein
MHATIHGERTLTDLDSILAITDFSAGTGAVLSRAAQLAAEHGATLKLMYAALGGDLPCPDAACRLSHHALQLGQRHAISVRTVSRTSNTDEDVASAARCADLVVAGLNRERSLLSFLRGQPVERLLRAARRPVLVVNPEAGAAQAAYGCLLVAVDFSEASRKLIAAAFALGKSAQVELFHAISTANEGKLRYAEVSDQAIKAYRQECRRYAQDRMFRLTDSTDARRNRVYSAIRHGDPARQVVVQQEHSGAELVVVGKNSASALSDFVFGSVAQRVLRHASIDVLVVPHDFQPATRAAAVRRLEQNPRAMRSLGG